jgi:hypothetical protein
LRAAADRDARPDGCEIFSDAEVDAAAAARHEDRPAAKEFFRKNVVDHQS